jgi:NADPH-dependent glutamate synthase beta subunit-like oxidoreductase
MNRKGILVDKYHDVEMFKTCEQCGRCSSACPLTGIKDFNIRRILRHVELDLIDEIAETPLPWSCTTCGRCESVCPNGIAILDIIRPLRSISPEEFVPEGPPPCTLACPARIDVPAYLRFIAEGRPEEAYKTILEKVPFPGILGRVCTHPCENTCKRGEVNEPIAICALKRYAADKVGTLPKGSSKIAPETGRKVAVIGAGPAGLTAAFYLRKKGHHVTIFEARPKPGGMMRYGIPSYRLPEDILDREIDQVLGLGIELKTNLKLGKDFDLDELQKGGFEAVFIAVGLPFSRKIELGDSGVNDVLWGLDFLKEVKEGRKLNLKSKVLVVGGGNVAVDAARVARRLGATDVSILYRRTRSEMPAIKAEVDGAEREGVGLHFLTAPLRVLSRDGKITGLRCIRMELGEPDESGRPSPRSIRGSEFELEADHLIVAVGQTPDREGILGEFNYSGPGLLPVNPDTLETDRKGIFAGGDIAKGPSSVIEAIEAGRRGATSIDKFLGGDGMIDETLAARQTVFSYTGKREEGFADRRRAEPPTLSPAERVREFLEVEGCLSDDQAVNEACRCLQCDLEVKLARRILSQVIKTPQ